MGTPQTPKNPFKPGDVCRVVQVCAFTVGSVVEILHTELYLAKCRLVLGEMRAFYVTTHTKYAWVAAMDLENLEKDTMDLNELLWTMRATEEPVPPEIVHDWADTIAVEVENLYEQLHNCEDNEDD